AEDWPQWRGLHRDGVWRETGIIEKFAGPEIPTVWRTKIGSGYTGPTVADGRVFLMDRQTDPMQIERVLCFDEKTGKSLWTHPYDCTYVKIGYQAGPRACVTIDGERAFALGAMGHLHCLNAKSGEVLWSHNCRSGFK